MWRLVLASDATDGSWAPDDELAAALFAQLPERPGAGRSLRRTASALPRGPAGPPGPAGKDGANGADGISGIANGQGTASIGTCDQSVKVILKSYWDFPSFSFKLDQVLMQNVSTNCSNQTLTLLLLDHSAARTLSTITFNTGQIASPEGTLTITRSQIGSVTSDEVTDVAFEISG